MVSQDGEAVAQEVLTPLMHDDSDGVQLADIGRGSMDAWAECLAKERDWVSLLEEDNSHGGARRVGLNSEGQVESQKGQDWSRRHGCFEHVEGGRRLRRPAEGIFT